MPQEPMDKFRSQIHGSLHAIKRRTRVFGEFKAFIAKGSALELAVGVVIGAAFNGVVTSFVKDVLTPIVSWPGSVDFTKLDACLKTGASSCAVSLRYGAFVTALISFLLTAAAVFFFVVRPVGKMRRRRGEDGELDEPASKTCPECLSEVPHAAIRCRACAIAFQ